LTNIHYVNEEIVKNREISINQREQIREYGVKVFSWKNVIKRYNELIQ